MTSNEIWLFNIGPHNWRSCADGPPDLPVHNGHVEQPWHGLNKNTSWAADQMNPGEIAIVRQPKHGVMGLWEIKDTAPVTSQSDHRWEEEYEKFIYCKGLHCELEPAIDDTQFFDGQDYVRFNAGANKLSEADAITFLEHLLDRSDLAEAARERAMKELEKMGVSLSGATTEASGSVSDGEPSSSSGRARTKSDPEERSVDLRPPKRTETTVSRIIRNTDLAKRLKNEYSHCCQVCGQQRQRGTDEPYAEAHHIHPLGDDPPGLDHESNILILCPNHHADFDFGMLKVDPNTLEISHEYDDQVDGTKLQTIPEHEVSSEHLRYHNQNQ